jgi:predicted HicB family RNase H-like nuclease
MPPQWWYDGGMDDEVKITVRLPRELHERVRALAAKDLRSLNAEVCWLLEIALTVEEQGGTR